MILALITSNMSRAHHSSRTTVLLGSAEGAGSGLRLDSVIMTDNLVTVLNAEIDSVLGSLSDMSEVETALMHTFGINKSVKKD